MSDPYERYKIPESPRKTFDPKRPFRFFILGYLFYVYGLFGLWKEALEEFSDSPIPITVIALQWITTFSVVCSLSIWIGYWALIPAIGQFAFHAYWFIALELWDKEERKRWYEWAAA